MRALAEKGPGQDTHWSTRTMAAQAGVSQSSVSAAGAPAGGAVGVDALGGRDLGDELVLWRLSHGGTAGLIATATKPRAAQISPIGHIEPTLHDLARRRA